MLDKTIDDQKTMARPHTHVEPNERIHGDNRPSLGKDTVYVNMTSSSS